MIYGAEMEDFWSLQGVEVFEAKDVFVLRNKAESPQFSGRLVIKLIQAIAENSGAVILWKITESDYSETQEAFRPIVVEIVDLKCYRFDSKSNQVVLIQKDGTTHPPLLFLNETPKLFIDTISRFAHVRQSKSDPFLYLCTDPKVAALDESLSRLNLLDRSNRDVVWQFMSDIQTDPYKTALMAFSKLTDKLIFGSVYEGTRPDDDVVQLMHQSLHGQNLDVRTGFHEDGEFEVVTSRPRLTSHLIDVPRSSPLCSMDWELHFDSNGRGLDVPELKNKIFKGGVSSEIRSEVWKFLLGYFEWTSSWDERAQLVNLKRKEYFRMKAQWNTLSETQEDNFVAFRERKVQIEKDIFRTDRNQSYFSGEENVGKLRDILMTYVMYNFDLGYVQGMSDLLSPILYVMNDEVDAFWSFVGFMNIVKTNFEIDQGGIKKQLNQLIELQKAVNPDLYAYLDAKDSGNMYFAFRWLLIWFKREFTYENIMRLWEILWTKLPCPNFHLLICLAILDGEKSTIVENEFGFTEILKHVNDMSHTIDLNFNLKKAEGMYIKFKDAPSEYGISSSALDILGLSAKSLGSSIKFPSDTHSYSSVECLSETEELYTLSPFE